MNIQFFGASQEVTGFYYLIEVAKCKILIECSMFQGGSDNEQRNNDEFPFSVEELDAVIISYTHLEHSGRLPLLLWLSNIGHKFVTF